MTLTGEEKCEKNQVFSYQHVYTSLDIFRTVLNTPAIPDDIIRKLESMAVPSFMKNVRPFKVRKASEVPPRFRFLPISQEDNGDIWYVISKTCYVLTDKTGRLGNYCMHSLLIKERDLEGKKFNYNFADLILKNMDKFVNEYISGMDNNKVRLELSCEDKSFENFFSGFIKGLGIVDTAKEKKVGMFCNLFFESIDKTIPMIVKSKDKKRMKSDERETFDLRFLRGFLSTFYPKYLKQLGFTTGEYSTGLNEFRIIMLEHDFRLNLRKNAEFLYFDLNGKPGSIPTSEHEYTSLVIKCIKEHSLEPLNSLKKSILDARELKGVDSSLKWKAIRSGTINIKSARELISIIEVDWPLLEDKKIDLKSFTKLLSVESIDRTNIPYHNKLLMFCLDQINEETDKDTYQLILDYFNEIKRINLILFIAYIEKHLDRKPSNYSSESDMALEAKTKVFNDIEQSKTLSPIFELRNYIKERYAKNNIFKEMERYLDRDYKNCLSDFICRNKYDIYLIFLFSTGYDMKTILQQIIKDSRKLTDGWLSLAFRFLKWKFSVRDLYLLLSEDQILRDIVNYLTTEESFNQFVKEIILKFPSDWKEITSYKKCLRVFNKETVSPAFRSLTNYNKANIDDTIKVLRCQIEFIDYMRKNDQSLIKVNENNQHYKNLDFDFDSISDWKGLISELKNHRQSYSERIYKILPLITQDAIVNCKVIKEISENVKWEIICGFNDLLRKKSLYNKNPFSSLVLCPEADNLLRKGLENLPARDWIRFNRLLLEAVFPNYIKKIDKTSLSSFEILPEIIKFEEAYNVLEKNEFTCLFTLNIISFYDYIIKEKYQVYVESGRDDKYLKKDIMPFAAKFIIISWDYLHVAYRRRKDFRRRANNSFNGNKLPWTTTPPDNFRHGNNIANIGKNSDTFSDNMPVLYECLLKISEGYLFAADDETEKSMLRILNNLLGESNLTTWHICNHFLELTDTDKRRNDSAVKNMILPLFEKSPNDKELADRIYYGHFNKFSGDEYIKLRNMWLIIIGQKNAKLMNKLQKIWPETNHS